VKFKREKSTSQWHPFHFSSPIGENEGGHKGWLGENEKREGTRQTAGEIPVSRG